MTQVLPTISKEDFEIHQRLLTDYPFFARHIQKIEPKDLAVKDVDDPDEKDFDRLVRAQVLALQENQLQGMIPFIFNPVQWKLHLFCQDMLKRLGFVRVAMGKPRQVGGSTFFHGMAHYLACNTPGLKIHIVSHNDASTKKFLRRARKMAGAAPPTVTPARQVENSNELIFDNGATWGIATAGNPDALRSDNAHFLHASEEAYWKEAERTTAAIIPALSDGPGSWGCRESTSQGKGNPWHKFIEETISGENEWELFFEPWYNHPKYQRTPPPGWEPNAESLDEYNRLRDLGVTLTKAQLYWRQMKIKSLRALWMFKQEFPSDIHESFQAPANTLYNPDAVNKAAANSRTNRIQLDPYAPLILGVDPARKGDRTVLAFRQGRVFRDVIVYPKMDDNSLVRIIAEYLGKGYKGTPVKHCFIDYAIGEGPASRLRDLGFLMQITSVHFGESADDTERYLNKRVEMAIELRDWFGDTGEHVQIPCLDRTQDEKKLADDIISDLLAIPDFMQSTGSEKIKLPPKDAIKKAYGKSPDIFDAMILTFAFPVAGERPAELQEFARQNYSHVEPSELARINSDFDGA